MMKQLKRIALGVSLAFAAAGSANAALVNGAATTTGSSLMLAAYGNVGGTILSYTRDLGAFLSSTLNLSGSTVDSATGISSAWNTAGFSFSSAGDSLFTSLFGTGGSAITTGTIKWSVLAVDSNSSPVPAQVVYTAATVPGTLPNNTSVLTTASNISNNFIAGSNAAGCTSATSCSTVGSGNDSAAGSSFTTALFGSANTFGSAFNSALSFYYSKTTSTSGLAGSSRAQFGGSWMLGDDGTVTYSVAGGSPVPLPAAAWLLASGLLGLAAVGRRRKNGSIA